MSKSVLISIQPKWIEKIAKGEKTVEVRKKKPNLETPFKCYIYCTKDKKYGGMILGGTNIPPIEYGKVIGEFICDKIYNFVQFGAGIMFADNELNQLEPQLIRDITCLTDKQIEDYLGEKDGYGWHISYLKIYDKPKELSEFVRKCEIPNGDIGCRGCEYFVNYKGYEYDESDCGCDGIRPLKRPPESWCYVKDIFLGKKVKGRNWF